MKTEVWAPPLGPLDLGSWCGLLPNDDVSEWVGYFWHGVFVPGAYPGLGSVWFEVTP